MMSVSGGSTSAATLKDLCRKDKDRVKKLVEDLAIIGTEKVSKSNIWADELHNLHALLLHKCTCTTVLKVSLTTVNIQKP